MAVWSFKRALKQAQVRAIRVHDLRHIFATLRLYQSINAKKISEMLGHSNVGITLAIYYHVTKQMDRKAVDRAQEWLISTGFRVKWWASDHSLPGFLASFSQLCAAHPG